MTLVVHPYAELFPMMPDAELTSLAADIKANGLKNDIVVDQHDRLIDGRNRERACGIAGVEATTEPRHFADDAAVLRFVLSANLHRRHLNESQRAMVAASIANLNNGQNKPARPIGLGGVTQDEAADLLNVGTRSVRRAKQVIASGTPELQQAVKQGEIPVFAAAKIATLPKTEQAEAIVERKKDGDPKPRQKEERDPNQQNESGPEPDPDNDPDARKSRGKGVALAHEAINCLARIPKNDPLRKRGFQIVKDWIRQAERGA